MKKVFVVYNPVSGRRKFRDLKRIIVAQLEKGNCTYDWCETRKEKNDFSAMLKGKYDLVLAVGGDGAVSEVATYMVLNKVNAVLGIVGTGSTNLLAVSLRIPVVDSARAVNFALKKEPRAIDVGLVNGKKVFLIAAGKGYDNVFMRGATRELKRRIGFFAYVWSFLTTYFAHRGADYRVEVDGEVHKVHAKAVLVFNFLRLRGIKFKHDDGIFEVVAVNPSLFSKYPKVRFFSGKKIKVISDDSSYQLDGDVFEGEKELGIEVLEKGMRVVY